MKKFIGLWILVGLVSVVGPSWAQEDDDAAGPVTGKYRYSAYSSVAECGFLSGETTLADLEGTEGFNPFLYVIGAGDYLFIVRDGLDYLYTQTGEGEYQGTILGMSDENSEEAYEGTLTVTAEGDLVESALYTRDADCTYTYNHTYTLEDEEVNLELWQESERTFTDLSFFNECLGRTGVEAPSGWTRFDWLVPMEWTSETAFLIGDKEFSDYFYQRELTVEETETTSLSEIRLNPTGEETLEKTELFQLNGRADCLVIYNSTLSRVEDLEGLVEAIYEDEG